MSQCLICHHEFEVTSFRLRMVLFAVWLSQLPDLAYTKLLVKPSLHLGRRETLLLALKTFACAPACLGRRSVESVPYRLVSRAESELDSFAPRVLCSTQRVLKASAWTTTYGDCPSRRSLCLILEDSSCCRRRILRREMRAENDQYTRRRHLTVSAFLFQLNWATIPNFYAAAKHTVKMILETWVCWHLKERLIRNVVLIFIGSIHAYNIPLYKMRCYSSIGSTHLRGNRKLLCCHDEAQFFSHNLWKHPRPYL